MGLLARRITSKQASYKAPQVGMPARRSSGLHLQRPSVVKNLTGMSGEVLCQLGQACMLLLNAACHKYVQVSEACRWLQEQRLSLNDVSAFCRHGKPGLRAS